MNKTFIFAIGFLSGSILTSYYLKNKEELLLKFKKYSEEKDVPEVYKNDMSNVDEDENYCNEESFIDPYFISLSDVADDDNLYPIENLILYKDGKCVDIGRDIVESKIIGEENINQILKENSEEPYEECYIRNDNIKCDFEITYIDKTYEEALNDMPFIRGD